MKKNSTETVFLTVGTKKQKLMSEKLISETKEKYGLDIHVVSDEDFGCRIGSGGALINVIGKNYNPGSKLLVINSGGMSKRSINYAIRGKSFANVKVDGETVSLFELLVINAKRISDKISQGVIVCCSDILVDTKNIETVFSNNVGICVRTDYETGSRHGVMFCDDKNVLQEYPHKISSEELQKKSLKYNQNGVFVDTGLIYFNDKFSSVLKSVEEKNNIVDKLVSNKIDLNLYPEIIALLAGEINKDEYFYSSLQNEEHLKIRKILFDVISPFSLEVAVLENRKFVHMGSLKESLANIIELSGEKDTFLNLNSYVEDGLSVGKNTVLDNVILQDGCSVGSGCIVSDISLDNGVKISDNKAVCGMKLSDGSFVTIICDTDENPKVKIDSKELWEIPRFYKGKSYTDSFLKFSSSADEEKYSLEYCTKNADVSYYLTRCQYIRDMRSYTVNPEYKKIRKKIIDKYFEKTEKLTHIKCLKDKVEVSLPVRVNLSGTWTDAMPYCTDNGGEVVNVAVCVDGQKPICVKVEKIKEKHIEFVSDNAHEIFLFDKDGKEEDLSDFNLHRAVLETVGIGKDTGLEDGFRLTTQVSSIDKGSGLGTSSILLVGCFKALGEMFSLDYDEKTILKMVFVAEQIMKTGGGWQDQVGGLFPAMKVCTSLPGIEQNLTIKQIDLSDKFIKFFSEKAVLVPTGQRHFGRFIVNDVVNRYLEKNVESLSAHKKIRQLNQPLINSIKSDDFVGFKNYLNEHFELLKKISPEVTNGKIDKLSQKLRESYADAVSICGAGGGGYLLVIMKDEVTAECLQDFVKNEFSFITGNVKRLDISY